MDKETKATNEELLRLVIEAQVKGGCTQYSPIISGQFHIDRRYAFVGEGRYSHVLGILLDTDGCKAAYVVPKHNDVNGIFMRGVSEQIIHAWHSGSGNNVRAALETAVSFLPSK